MNIAKNTIMRVVTKANEDDLTTSQFHLVELIIEIEIIKNVFCNRLFL